TTASIQLLKAFQAAVTFTAGRLLACFLMEALREATLAWKVEQAFLSNSPYR
ncbi:Hypothetical protein FKW44_007601, partial [Caligus rogercresseyi]